jgi:ribosomal protein L29
MKKKDFNLKWSAESRSAINEKLIEVSDELLRARFAKALKKSFNSSNIRKLKKEFARLKYFYSTSRKI